MQSTLSKKIEQNLKPYWFFKALRDYDYYKFCTLSETWVLKIRYNVTNNGDGFKKSAQKWLFYFFS